MGIFQLLYATSLDQHRTFQKKAVVLLVISVISDFIIAVLLPLDLRSRREQQVEDSIAFISDLDLQFGQVHVFELGPRVFLLLSLGQQHGQSNARVGRLHGDSVLSHRHAVNIHTRSQGQ